MPFELRAITDTHGIRDDETKRRYVYVDHSTGKSMTLHAPLFPTDDVEGMLNREPIRQHTTSSGTIRIVTTWSCG